MRIRVNFIRPEETCFLGHIDLTRAVTRGLRRTLLPLQFTEGFNRRVKVEMGFPLSVGMVGEDEYFDFYLSKRIDKEGILYSLRKAFEGIIFVKSIKEVPYDAPAITSMNAILVHFVYGISQNASEEDAESAIENILMQKSVFVTRSKKGKSREKEVRLFIKELKLLDFNASGSFLMLFSTVFTREGSIKIDEIRYILSKFGFASNFTKVVRKKTSVLYKGKLLSLMEF